ncbi:MAG: DEAD/DEAH box helicase [Anaerolineales bacterium]|nr:DEAD/DEAH box helicase [Anaerolineales bacterium]
MTSEFDSFDLHPQLVQAVVARGYQTPTPIQSAMIPLMLSGVDVIGQAQTGTGKTAAFALPLLHNLQPGLGMVQALVLTPTRELALQVSKFVYDYGQLREVSVLPVYGGSSYSRQINRLKRGVDVVVGTPGRLLDLLRQQVLDLSAVHTVVLDEADEMLSMGFIEDIEAILDQTPALRQTALFSATLPPDIRRLAGKYLREPQTVRIEAQQVTVAAIDQRYYRVNAEDKTAALTRLFEVEDISRAIIFTRTRLGTGELANELVGRGFPAEALSGDLTQEAREQVMGRFRNDQLKVLVATDVAARGLDIEDISHVINYDLPEDPELYVHRIGRTGRAGKTGIAISLITPREQWRLARIERFARQKIRPVELPSEADILAQREARLLAQVEMWLRRNRGQRERQIITDLVAAGHDPLEIAAAALKVARADEKQRPIAPISAVVTKSGRDRNRREAGNRGEAGSRWDRQEMRGNTRKPNLSRLPDRRGDGPRPERNSHETGMVRLLLSRGRQDGVRPNDVVGAIAANANIPGSAIGKILIQDQHTLVDVPEQFVPQVLARSGVYRIHQQAVEIEVA